MSVLSYYIQFFTRFKETYKGKETGIKFKDLLLPLYNSTFRREKAGIPSAPFDMPDREGETNSPGFPTGGNPCGFGLIANNDQKQNHERISFHILVVETLLPQTPPEHAQCDRQRRGVVHPHLPGRSARRVSGFRAAAFHPHSVDRSLYAGAGTPARLPRRSGPLARESNAKRHPSGFHGADDERHDYL